MLADPQLKSKVDPLWDRFWSGGISNPITAIEQMSYLIFLKRLEDMDNARAAAAKRVGRVADSSGRDSVPTYKSIFHGNKSAKKTADRKCRWSYWSQFPGDQMHRLCVLVNLSTAGVRR